MRFCLSSTLFALLSYSTLCAQAPSTTELALAGIALMPDGTPAAGASVLCGSYRAKPIRVRADEQGEFRFQTACFMDANISVASSDLRYQATRRISAADLRRQQSEPLQIKLRYARRIEIELRKDGRPVGSAFIGIRDRPLSWTKTNPDGNAIAWVPANEKVDIIWAFHAQEGVALWDPDKSDRQLQDGVPLALSMHSPRRHRLLLQDQFGDPVAGVVVGCSVNIEDEGYVLTSEFPNARGTTDQSGVVNFDWFPEKTRYIDAEIFDAGFLHDRTELADDRKSTTLGLRRRIEIPGKIHFQDGKPRAGVLVTGRSFGPHSQGDILGARTNERGEFTLAVAPDHAYTIAVSDRDWGSEIWSGLIAKTIDDKKNVQVLVESLVLEAKETTPVEVVVQNADGRPIVDRFVLVSRTKDLEWTGISGETRRAHGSMSNWIKTDDQGIANFGAVGACSVRVSDGDWQQTKEIDVLQDDAIQLQFVRPATRHLVGHVLAESNRDWTNTKIIALASGEGRTTRKETTANSAGEFEFKLDGQDFRLFAITSDGKLSAVQSHESQAEDQTIELRMIPCGTYSGVLVDENEQPIAERELCVRAQYSRRRFLTKTSWVPETSEYIQRCETTDSEGRFEFEGIPTGVELSVYVKRLPGGSKATDFRLNEEMFFEEGEVRDNIILRARGKESGQSAKETFDERVAQSVANAQVAAMRVSITLRGNSESTEQFVNQTLLSSRKTKAALDYLFVVQSVDESKLDTQVSTFLKKHNLKLPDESGIVIALLDGNGNFMESLSLNGTNREADHASAQQLLTRCAPQRRDAATEFANVLRLAKQTDRKVLIQAGGPRCGPCFALGKWLKTQKPLIEKDFVVLKIDLGRDEHADEVKDRLNVNISSIPWMAIVDSAGNVLADSKSGLGNIGFPSQLESLRHFRRMLESTRKHMSDADIDAVIVSRN